MSEQRTVVITGVGAERGIGRATAHRFARDGWGVVGLDLDGDSAEKLAGELTERYGVPAFGARVDVASEESVLTVRDAVRNADLPTVGAVINIAGLTSPVPFLETTLELWNKIFAVNATGTYLTITGGTLAVDSGGDGLDSNGSASVSGGTIVVNGPTENGNGALDVVGAFTVSGGSLIAVGSAGMAQAPDTSSPQGWVAATFAGQAAGSTVEIVAADGQVVASFVAAKSFASVVYSSADVVAESTYSVVVDGATVATVTARDAPASGMMGPGGR